MWKQLFPLFFLIAVVYPVGRPIVVVTNGNNGRQVNYIGNAFLGSLSGAVVEIYTSDNTDAVDSWFNLFIDSTGIYGGGFAFVLPWVNVLFPAFKLF